MILDMGNAEDTPLILGHPFLNTANACIHVASGQIQFTLLEEKKYLFLPLDNPSLMRNRKEEAPVDGSYHPS